MSDDTYEGWSNRETWAIQLHLSNNEGDYRQMCEKAEELVKESSESDDWNSGRTAVGLMADYIKEWTEEVFDSVLYGDESRGYAAQAARLFVGDVGSWWRADFYEIAEHWIDEARDALAEA